MTVEIACKEGAFHFNKKHLEDPTIPMWTIKTGGKSYYINHMTCLIPWSTKETPNSSHTKGAIKIKNALLVIDDNNDAMLHPLTKEDVTRLKKPKKHYARILVSNRKGEINDFIEQHSIEHGPVKKLNGGCGTSFNLISIAKKEDMVLLSLAFPTCYRILQENEELYKSYDNQELLDSMSADDYEDEYNDYDFDDDDED